MTVLRPEPSPTAERRVISSALVRPRMSYMFRALLVVSATIPFAGSAADWTVYLRRAGPLRIGMTLAEVKKVLGDPRAMLKGNEPTVPLSQCPYLESTRTPTGLGLMFAGGHLVRID